MFVFPLNAAERPTTVQKTCMTSECHSNYQESPFLHGPVGLGDCGVCHRAEAVMKHTFALTLPEPALCQKCHLDQDRGEVLHAPMKNGCTQCHDPHVGDTQALLRAGSIAQSCAACHAETTQGMAFLHGPTAIGQCTICHDPHSSDEKGLLVEPHTELCFSCHETTREDLKTFPFVHQPAADNCISCHNSHGADNPMMLIADTPQLCYPCHEKIQTVAETALHPHTPVTETGGCLKCHTPHASTVRFGLKADPMTLCLTCHSEPVPMDSNEVLPAFSHQIAGKDFHHGPIAQRECSGCHDTHGSDHFRLLVKEYPATFYSPFKREHYDLCFSCHPDTLVLTRRTDQLTDFRNGDQNLHFLHVNKERRGRSCRTCHETHASRSPKHIRSSVPYGRWELPIRFKPTETGGSCQTGCHLPYAYDRETPIQNIAKKSAKQ